MESENEAVSFVYTKKKNRNIIKKKGLLFCINESRKDEIRLDCKYGIECFYT